ARERVKAEDMEDKVDLQLLEYSALPEDASYDKVVSVGMFEHVGQANLPLYAQCVFGGVMAGGLLMNNGNTARHRDGRTDG
ncbi:class I SAM-dependent methyltransferase, partial [Pseudomonas syringae group genomosp. 7]|uniref:class I SAM-dependent methyltransferase n=1 Tax=Pseudomonas syringae group genomosp. 7 TaxID=251699 RepID=UPI00376F8513